MNDIDALREEIRRERERVNERLRDMADRFNERMREAKADAEEHFTELERKVAGSQAISERLMRYVQGDPDLKEKGLVDKILDINAQLADVKEADLKTVIPILRQLIYVGKYFWWLIGGTGLLVAGASGLLYNLDKIQNFFHHG